MIFIRRVSNILNTPLYPNPMHVTSNLFVHHKCVCWMSFYMLDRTSDGVTKYGYINAGFGDNGLNFIACLNQFYLYLPHECR